MTQQTDEQLFDECQEMLNEIGLWLMHSHNRRPDLISLCELMKKLHARTGKEANLTKVLKNRKNTLTLIGFLGCKTAYLNLDQEEAIARFCETEDITREEFDARYNENYLETFTFTDTFGAYDCWEPFDENEL